MKSIVAVLTLTLGFGLCNLSGWSNKNANNSNNANSTAGSNENTDRSQSEEPTIAEGPPRRSEPKPSASERNVDERPPPAPPTPRRPTAPISGGVLNGKAISLPKPPYPAIAKAAHASGTVTVQVLIDEEGKVVTASAVSGHPLLQAAAVSAARQAKFAPTKLSGQPVKISGVIVYNFVAQ